MSPCQESLRITSQQARDFLQAAKDNWRKGRYHIVVLAAQMCAELALKALISAQSHTECKTHNLRSLARKASEGKKDDLVYIAADQMQKRGSGGRLFSDSTRYQKSINDLETHPKKFYNKENSHFVMERAQEILEEVEKRLNLDIQRLPISRQFVIVSLLA